MPSLYRTISSDPDFVALVALLDAELAERDGEDHSFYDQFNHIESLKYIVLLKENQRVIGCGAIKGLDNDIMEVKRMYVLKEFRGKGLASLLLAELEHWTFELGYSRCRLETGKRQPEAIALYLKNGYRQILNYGQYKGIENSVCFEKRVSRAKT